MEKKRIMIVSDAWEPQVNGVVNAIRNVRRVLKQQDCKVYIISPAMFATIPCPTYPEIKLAMATRKHFKAIFKKAKPDHVHICTEGPVGMAAKLYCDKKKFRYTTSYHTKFPEYIRERIFMPLSISYEYIRWFHKRAEKTLVPTESVAAELRERNFKNLVVWTRGANKELFQPGYKDVFKDLRHPVYLYAGRVAVEKNLDAFMNLKIDGTKVLVGDGPYLATLKENYPEAVFTGFRRGKDLAACYASADAFVFPSKTDTFGQVLIEAASCGTPCVAFNVPGPKDVLTPGINAILAENREEMEQACGNILTFDREEVVKSVENYTWERCAEIFLENLVKLKS